jgi:hypothetical protein
VRGALSSNVLVNTLIDVQFPRLQAWELPHSLLRVEAGVPKMTRAVSRVGNGGSKDDWIAAEWHALVVDMAPAVLSPVGLAGYPGIAKVTEYGKAGLHGVILLGTAEHVTPSVVHEKSDRSEEVSGLHGLTLVVTNGEESTYFSISWSHDGTGQRPSTGRRASW